MERRAEDLGVQMNRHSTLVSYLEKVVWLLTGNLANPGGQYAMTGIGNMLRMSRSELHPTAAPVSPAVVTVAVDETIQPGHVSLPNGFGLDHVEAGARSKTGVGTNEFTASEDRDPWAGTPWHKTTPARLEPV